MPLNSIRNLFTSPLDDDDYWDKKATALTYLAEVHSGDALASNSDFNGDLYARAKSVVGDIQFQEMTASLDINNAFAQLTLNDQYLAIAFGISGVLSAYAVNQNSKIIEDKFLDFHIKYKPEGTSPLDYRTGAKHRYYFGHDWNVFQKLPEKYSFGGQEVGGKSLYELVANYIGENFEDTSGIFAHLKTIAHILTHMLSDLPTKDGLPLPFTSLFTEWNENPLKVSGYSSENKLMEQLGREYGTINLADVSTYAVIKILISGHHSIKFNKSELGKDQKKLHLCQMNTIAYGSALYIQILLLAIGVDGNKHRTAKLNYLIAGPFVYNSIKSILITNRIHKGIMVDYDNSINQLEKEEITIDQWAKEI